MKIKSKLLRALPPRALAIARLLRNRLVDVDVVRAYSQEGEDGILRRVFAGKERGFYIDVGAHHPRRFSNTYFFYKQGWNGINIDASPGSMREFNRLRPRDKNLEIAIAMREQTLTFYVLNDPALNTFDRDLARKRAIPPYRLVAEIEVAARPLADVLSEVMSDTQKVDFLSIDVEGYDVEVLKSNNWNRVRPAVVLVECFGVRGQEIRSTDAGQLLAAEGYEWFAKTVNTVLFADSAQLEKG